MSNMQVNSVLAQIRALSAQVKPLQMPTHPLVGAQPTSATQVAGAGSFADLMKQGLSQVNQAQSSANSLATSFQQGTPGVELSDVMIEMQKASVGFRAVTEVRNRMVSAYQEIMSMQI